ncbi:cell growth regulator with EF hand domain protein 1 [Guaruba guarouba]
MGPGAGQTLPGRAHPVQTVKRMRDQPRRWRLGCERGSPGTVGSALGSSSAAGAVAEGPGHAPSGVWTRSRGAARPCNNPAARCPASRRGPAPERACVTAAATSGAGTGAGCRLTPTLPGSPGVAAKCRRVGPTGAIGGGRVSYVASGGAGGAETVLLKTGRDACVRAVQAVYAVRRPALPPPPGASVSSPRWTRWTLPGAARPSHGCRSRPVPAGSGKGGRGRHCDLPMGRSLCSSHPTVASSRWMRKALALLLLLVSGVPAAPQGGGYRPEDPAAMRLDPDFDLLSPELPTLLLLQRTVQSLAMPEQDVEALTREQVLLYLFVLHDHDRNGHLDGLELLQLLSTVLAQRNGGQPHLDMVAVLVDQALERQDVSRDGLLNPPELLLDPPKQLLSLGQGQGAPGPPLLPHPREPEVLGGNMGVNGPGLGPAEKQEEGQEALQAEIPQAESPDGGLMEVEDTLKIEAPEAEVPKAEAAPVWGDPREG